MSGKLPLIMILDDEIAVRDSLGLFLEDEGFDIITAESSEIGLKLLLENDVKLCTVDMRLSGKDGNEFIIKAKKLKPDLRFIIHTGSMEYTLPSELKEIGMKKEDIFIKPVYDMTVLSNYIKKRLNN